MDAIQILGADDEHGESFIAETSVARRMSDVEILMWKLSDVAYSSKTTSKSGKYLKNNKIHRYILR